MRSDPARAGDLVQRLAALLLLTAAALFALLATAGFLLDRTIVQGSVRYLLPGSHATLDPAIIAVMTSCAALTGVPGLALLAIGQAGRRVVGMRSTGFQRGRRRPFLVLAAGIAMLALAVVLRRASF